MKTIRIAAALFAVAVLNLSPPALADQSDHRIEVVDAWARASLAGTTNGAAFISVLNGTDMADRIVGVECAVAAKAELHTHMMNGGLMKMRPVEAVDLQAGETATMGPGGLHVMLLGLTEPLTEGMRFPVTLILEKSGPVQAEVVVRASNARGVGHGGMKMDDGGHGHGHGGMKMDGGGHGHGGKTMGTGGHGKMKMQTDD